MWLPPFCQITHHSLYRRCRHRWFWEIRSKRSFLGLWSMEAPYIVLTRRGEVSPGEPDSNLKDNFQVQIGTRIYKPTHPQTQLGLLGLPLPLPPPLVSLL